MWEEILIFGCVQGCVYALIALGYSLVYGVGGVLNLGHGSYYLIGIYTFYMTWQAFGTTDLGFYVGMIVGLASATILGLASYFAIIKPLEEVHISMLMGTFAVGFFIEQLVIAMQDSRMHSLTPIWDKEVSILGVSLIMHWIIIIIVSFIVVAIVILFINKAKMGKSIRAVSQDREAAMLMGINADRILMYTVMISAFLAGVAAVIYCPVDLIAPYKGWPVLTGAIAVVILGGMGSIPGSVIGAFILGYARLLTDYLIDPVYSSLIPVIVILFILVVRPRGLFGKKEID